ncbi:MAG: divalent metal cation transporter, partial [Verrucomicrobiota bacterium]
LQSAITLGGGSLAGALYLGVLGGYNLLWIQIFAMICGVIMLSAISYVTLSTGRKPFGAINEHISPVLGWSWAIATLMANIVWCLPQFALGTAAVQQNLIPALSGDGGKAVICVVLLALAVIVIWFYDSGSKGIKIFEVILKVMVGIVVLSFFGVVITMSSKGGLPWSEILGGFIPDFSLFSKPSPVFEGLIKETSEFSQFWHDKIMKDQLSVMITAAATAVGINMTFLLPYSMLKKGWDKDFRGLAIFDLSTGLFIPFVIATSCVVIASASQFHGKYHPGLLGEEGAEEAPAKLVDAYNGNIDARLKAELGGEAFGQLDEAGRNAAVAALPLADRKLAAMLVKRDAFNLANALKPLTGDAVAQYVFGIGVLGMALSTIIILMLISGFTFCEILNLPHTGWPHRIGCLVAGIGVIGPFIWSKAAFWLAVPTSLFGMCLLPIAYLTFFLMMNSKSLLGDALPQGGKRIQWNVLMGIALAASIIGAGYSIWSRTMEFPKGSGVEVRWIGIALMALIVIGAIFIRGKKTGEDAS